MIKQRRQIAAALSVIVLTNTVHGLVPIIPSAHAQTITTGSSYAGMEGETLVIPFGVQTGSNNTNPVTYSITPMPSWAILQRDPATTGMRLIGWPGFSDAGVYNLTFTADDGTGVANKAVTVTIADRTDGTPGIKISKEVSYDQFELMAPTDIQTTTSLYANSIRIDVIDPDDPNDTTASVSVSGLPASFAGVQDKKKYWRGTGTIKHLTWQLQSSTQRAEAGAYTATISATDSGNQTSSTSVEFEASPRVGRNYFVSFFPHVVSGSKDSFFNSASGIKHDVVDGTITLRVVAGVGTQGGISGNDPNYGIPASARFRLHLHEPDGAIRPLGGTLQGTQTVTLDTTTLAEGNHMVSVELIDGDEIFLWFPWSLMLTVDNDNIPIQGSQPIHIAGTRGTYSNSWHLPNGSKSIERITVGSESRNTVHAYPYRIMNQPLAAPAGPDMFLEHVGLAYSFREQPTPTITMTDSNHVFLDAFIGRGGRYSYPQASKSGLAGAKKNIGFDGGRNDAFVHDLTMYIADPSSDGAIGMEPSGRVVRAARDGTVTTLFGPRLKRTVHRYNPGDLDISTTQFDTQLELFLGTVDVPLSNPYGFVADPLVPDVFFIADMGNNRIAKLDLGALPPALTTYAGAAGTTGYVDGPASTARFNSPIDLAADPVTGELYVTDRENHAIRRVARDGTVSTVVGQGPDSVPDQNTLGEQINQHGDKNTFVAASVPIASALIYFPRSIDIDSNRNLIISESVTSAVRRVNFGNGNVERLIVPVRWGSAAPWLDVDSQGILGPIDGIWAANNSVSDTQFEYYAPDGSSSSPIQHHFFYLLGAEAGGLFGYGGDPLPTYIALDDNSSAAFLTSHHRPGLFVLRPNHPSDVLVTSVDATAFKNGRTVAGGGTAASFVEDRTHPWAVLKSIRPTLSNISGPSGHAFIGTTLTYDDLAAMTDANLATYIRNGFGGSVPRPEITGIDLRDLIYFIRVNSVQGKTVEPNVNTIASNLQNIGLYDTSDARPAEIRDLTATALSDTVIRVNYVTDEDTIGFVQYGTTFLPGQNSTVQNSFGKTHEVTLTNLIPDRTYYIRIVLKDKAGNPTTSQMIRAAVGNPDTVPPTTPTNFSIDSTTATSMNLSWNASTDDVEFGEYKLDVSTSSNFATYVTGYFDRSLGDVLAFNATGLLPETTYYTRVSAVDAAGNESAHSNVDSATTPEAPPNTAPTVDAGTNQSITTLDSAALDGTVTDDGLPIPPSLTYTWSKVSGPGTVNFADSTAVDTTATFSAEGSYVLKLDANDGDLVGSDTTNVTVTPPPGGGLLAHWKFDGDVLDSARSNHGTNNGGAFAAGKHGQALSLDGTNFVEVQDTSGILSPNKITIAAWINPSVASNGAVLSRGASSSLVYAFRTTLLNGGEVLFNVRNSDGGNVSPVFSPLPNNTWTHVALTWDSTETKLYKNGVLEDTDSFVGTALNTATWPVYIGGSAFAVGAFDGMIDDMRIYSTALSQEDIVLAMNNIQPICLTGRLENRLMDGESRMDLPNVDVTITDTATSTVLKDVTLPMDTTGTITLSDSTGISDTGTYNIAVRPHGLLTKTLSSRTNVISGGCIDAGTFQLVDTNGDGLLELADLVGFVNYYRTLVHGTLEGVFAYLRPGVNHLVRAVANFIAKQ